MYNSVIRGLINYYSFVHNYGKLVAYIIYNLKQSCAKLLAAKFKLFTQKKVYERFGPLLSTKNSNGQVKADFIKPNYKITIKFNIKSTPIIQSLFGSKSLSTLNNLICVICSSEYRVEMHHIRAMKYLNPNLSLIDKLMIKRKRKQIPLCRECHMKYHNKNKT